MAALPSRGAAAAASFIAGLSPAESVIVYGDRLLETRDRAASTTARLPLSGRHTDVDKLAFTGLCSALGALEAAGEFEITLRPRKGLIRTREHAHVRQSRSHCEWPRHSPEARLRAWLAQADDREAWLVDLIAAAVVPEVATFPHRVALEYLVGGLVKRGIVEAVERRAIVFFRVTEYQVVESAAAELQRVTEEQIDESLRVHEILSPRIREKCRDAWRGAIQLRSDTP